MLKGMNEIKDNQLLFFPLLNGYRAYLFTLALAYIKELVEIQWLQRFMTWRYYAC